MPDPKPGKPEKHEPAVEIIPQAETHQPQPTEVDVDLATGQTVVTRQAEPTVSAEEFRKLQARMEYQARQFERSQREWENRLSQMQNPQPAPSPAEKPEADDIYGLNREDLNQMGQNDWTKPVKLMAEKIAEKKAEEKFKALMEAREKAEQERIKQQTETTILEREKQWVIEQQPALNDETSDEFKGFYATYNKMIAEDPTLLKNPRAPRLVYREWQADSVKTEKSDPEKERLKRVAGGVAPQGRPSSPSKTVRLTQDEVDFCKEKGISPAVYAQMKETNFKEGVTA